MPQGTARMQIRALNKTFGPVKVLHDVELSVQPGEVHGLAGQNGSGKSTLIKILTGVYAPDPGASYEVDGRPMRLPVRWREVRAAGLAVVHQDLGLLDQLSVAENICIGGFPTSRVMGRIDRSRRDALAAHTLERLGVALHTATPVSALSAPERAEVAIARAMRDHDSGTGLIILDESTRALAGDDLRRIHSMLRRITADGSSAVIISHNLTELMEVTDRLSILRDGRLAGSGLVTAGLGEEEIARRMLGSALAVTAARSTKKTEVPRQTVTISGVSGKRAREVSFSLGNGEIVGITGLPGNGYEEIPYLLAGAVQATAGKITTRNGSVDLRKAGVSACIRAGLVLVPERRERDGLAFEMSMRDNISLPALKQKGRPWFVARKWQRDSAESAVRLLDIRPNLPNILVKQLSGGNQQKVLLAKWLSIGPSVLVLHEPTQAVDIGARQDILTALRRAADDGMAVILVSSEPEDLAAACDRVLIYNGETGMVESDSTTPDLLIEQIYGADRGASAGAKGNTP
jgi:ribose transport system ATP-binding protein